MINFNGFNNKKKNRWHLVKLLLSVVFMLIIGNSIAIAYNGVGYLVLEEYYVNNVKINTPANNAVINVPCGQAVVLKITQGWWTYKVVGTYPDGQIYNGWAADSENPLQVGYTMNLTGNHNYFKQIDMYIDYNTTNYSDYGSDYPFHVTFKAQKVNISPTVSMTGYAFGGTKSTPSVNGNLGGGTVTYYYSTSNANSGGTAWTNVANSSSLSPRTYYMYATVAATTAYNAATTPAVAFTVSKGSISPSVSMAGYTYGGTKSSPTISGNKGNGTVTYYYNTSNSNSGGTAWSSVANSTSLNARTYYMYAIVGATANYNGGTSPAVAFTVSKASISPSVSMLGYTYGGEKNSPTISGNKGNGTVTYYYNTSNINSGGTAWSSVADSTSLNARTYYMYATIGATTNYKSGTSPTVAFTISKAPSVNPTISDYSGTFDGLPHSIEVSGGSGGTIYYSTDNLNWSDEKPTRTGVGETIVYVKIIGDSNHTDTTPISASIMIIPNDYETNKVPKKALDVTSATTDSSEYLNNSVPTFIKTSGTNISTETTWSKNKSISISVQDTPTDVVGIKIQNVANGLGNNQEFTDEYGYTRKIDTTTPTTWTREYSFTGNVKGSVSIIATAENPLNNHSSTLVNIYNLDNSNPYISGSMSVNPASSSVSVNLCDDFSGIKYFGIVDSITQELVGDKVYPTEYDTSTAGTTQATLLDKWYQVPLVAASGTNPESGASNVTVTMNVKKDGRHYIVMEDYVGNRSFEAVQVSGLDIEAPTGTIDVLNTTLVKGKEFVSTRNVTVSVYATDNSSGVDQVALINEDSIPVSNISWIPWTGTGSIFTGTGNTKTAPWSLSANDGDKTIYLVLKDKSGNTSVIPKIDNTVKYAITYNNMGGSGGPNPTYKYKNTPYTIPNVTPVKDGFIFKGWDTNSSGTNVVYNIGGSYTQDEDITFYAVWEYSATPTISVTDYNTFSYASTSASAYYVSTTQSTMPSAGSTAAISTFALNTWTTATSTGDLTLSGNQTYYVWAKDIATGGQVSPHSASIVTRTVTRNQGVGTLLTTRFNSSGGTEFTDATVYALNGSKVNVSAILREGYVSLVLMNGSTAISAGDQTLTDNTIFTSSASETTEILSYDANGHGTAPASVTMTYTQPAYAAGSITGVSGYTFTGWKDGAGNSFPAGALLKAANVVPPRIILYAQWHKDTCGGNLYLYNPSNGTLENPIVGGTLVCARNGAYCNRCKKETFWYYDSWFIYKCDKCGATERHNTPSTRWWCSTCLEYIHVGDYKVYGEKMRSFSWGTHDS